MIINENTIRILNLLYTKNIRPSEISKVFKEKKDLLETYRYFCDSNEKCENIKATITDFKDHNDSKFNTNILKEIIADLRNKKYFILNIEDEDYPFLLKEIFFSPPILYFKGKKSVINNKLKLGIVGTRNCTKYGKDVADFFGRELSKLGFTIVSGMASGIDKIAHEAALKEKGGSIGVLGSGINIVYPGENKQLFKKFSENGCLVTEFSPNAMPLKQNFPARNRIISGLSIGVIVIEAGEKSGALITAKTALRENREVFAVPGNIFSEKSSGCHSLIKDGAKLIENIDDIMVEIQNYINNSNIGNGFNGNLTCYKNIKDNYNKYNSYEDDIIFESKIYGINSDEYKKVLTCIGFVEKSFEDIGKETCVELGKLMKIISFLEFKGYIREKSFNSYVLNK